MPARYGMGRVGRSLGTGVASESVARGEGSVVGVSAWRMVAAGMSSTRVSSRLATANGPDPIGWRPNGVVASSATGISPSRCCGAMGWVAAWRKPPSGVASVNTIVRLPFTWTLTSFQDRAAGPV